MRLMLENSEMMKKTFTMLLVKFMMSTVMTMMRVMMMLR